MVGGQRSLESRRRSFLRFYNMSPRAVDVIWLDFEGKEVPYTRLLRRQKWDVTTFVSHPWICRDSESRELMAVVPRDEATSLKKVFTPGESDSYPYPEKTRALVRQHQKHLLITLPLTSLRDHCFLVLLNQGLALRDVPHLGLPQTLQRDLLQFAARTGRVV
jgi:hypothetical protein